MTGDQIKVTKIGMRCYIQTEEIEAQVEYDAGDHGWAFQRWDEIKELKSNFDALFK